MIQDKIMTTATNVGDKMIVIMITDIERIMTVMTLIKIKIVDGAEMKREVKNEKTTRIAGIIVMTLTGLYMKEIKRKNKIIFY